MLRMLNGTWRYLLVAALCMNFCALNGCVESTFELASGSRLPVGLTLPPGVAREDVSVTLKYYTLGDARFHLLDKSGKTLAGVAGKVINNDPLEWPGCKQGAGRQCPVFEVVAVHGVTEILVHQKMKPVFYVNDDPGVRFMMLLEVGRKDRTENTRKDPERAWRYGQLRPQ